MYAFLSTPEIIRPYLTELQSVIEHMPHSSIDNVVRVLFAAYQNERMIFIVGNGGSAATASHFANDLAKATIVPGMPRFRVVALTDNVPLLTAWANDVSYADAFAEQLQPLIRSGDVLVAISGSGNSENILRAARAAHLNGATVIGFTGFDGGRLRLRCDHGVHVPCHVMAQVEDVHLIVQHAICTALREVIAHASDTLTFPAADG